MAKATKFLKDTQAALSTSSMLSVVYLIVGVVVVLAILAALTPVFFSNLGAFIENLTAAEFGDSSAANIAETIVQVLAIVVAIGGAVVLVALATAQFEKRSK